MSTQGGRRLRYFYFWLAAALTVLVDLLSKSYIFAFLDADENQHVVVIGGLLDFTKSVNPGAVWGLGADSTFLIMGATALILPCMVLMAYSCTDKTAPIWSLGLILGGAGGNLYDRIFTSEFVIHQGGEIQGVRDFIDVGNNSIGRWPVFNIADVAIVVGVAVYFIWNIRLQEPAEEKSESTADESE